MNTDEAQNFWSQYSPLQLQFGLRKLSTLPIEHHHTAAWEFFKQSFSEKLSEVEAQPAIALGLVFMKSLHMAFGRAVQPTGELNPIAAAIGAIRLGDPESHFAKQQVADVVIRAYQANDSHVIAAIKRFATSPLGKHRNFQVWIAIRELLESQAFGASKILSTQLEEKLKSGPLEVRFLPTTKEVKDYVKKHSTADRFSKLPPNEDGPSWAKVFALSGAAAILEKGRRGPSPPH